LVQSAEWRFCGHYSNLMRGYLNRC
jgi:hypothetical protein